MARKKKRQQDTAEPESTTGADAWAEAVRQEQIEAIDESSPANAKTVKWRKRYRLAVWSAVIGLPLVSIADIAMVSALMNPNYGQTQSSEYNQVSSVGKSAAYLELEDWLANEPAPLPGATILSWDGYDTAAQDSNVAQTVLQQWGERDYSIEIHHFTLAGSSGVNYAADVTVAVDQYGQSEVIGTPTALPVAPSSTGWSNDGAWMNVIDVTAGESVDEAVSNWAKAYTSGDSATLRLAVGDGDASHTYMALSGVDAVKATIVRSGYVAETDGKTVTNKQENPSTIIAQLKLQITWSGQDAKEVESKGVTQSMDVLITGADTASPKVVAWGAVGTGPTLKAGDNAITGRQIKEKTTSPSTSASPSPSATSSPTMSAGASPSESSTPESTAQPQTETPTTGGE
ncbi:hypothetical protein [Pseudoclavibacter soli]|uniref:hypothetical protein n=1 Tax=Pseudoclavibacter soli TaxID=452623 RepID=UPI00047FF05C|nr:hypothetical protein [Pseudoclavibacter soli]